MIHKFLCHIDDLVPSGKKKKILLAVSGGIDSMVMLNLFHQGGYDIGVAHIDHDTREGASTRDRIFVQEHCECMNIPFYFTKGNKAELNEGNFQQNARQLRYDFFEQIMQKHKYDYLATAHHQDDRWETFLMHLHRKSGIYGLTSLAAKNGHIIRPLLIFRKNEILAYAKKQNIPYVHDSSNDEDHYLRNKIRHHLTPKVEEILPEVISHSCISMDHLQELKEMTSEVLTKTFVTKNKRSKTTTIDLEKIEKYNHAVSILYHILSPYGFDASICQDLLQSMRTGAWFESTMYECIIDRKSLILRKKAPRPSILLTIERLGEIDLQDGRTLVISEREIDGCKTIIDKTKIKWPIILRNIKKGDKFRPAKMKGKTKTMKKYCTDHKINRFEKADILVLEMEEKIIGVVDYESCWEMTPDIKSQSLYVTIHP